MSAHPGRCCQSGPILLGFDDMMKRKLELPILGTCAVLGVVWAFTTDYFRAAAGEVHAG
jgi:hypothetical protein